MDNLPYISVLIINWNGAKVLPRCLQALQAQTFTDFEVLVLDNASSDGSRTILAQDFPEAKVIDSKENLGFAEGNNRAAALARGRWLFLLNNDAFPAPDCLENLIQATQAHPEYSFFACKLVTATGESKWIDGTGDIYHVSGCAWHRDRNLPLEQGTSQPGEVFSACAAAALFDRQKFLQVGGFNPRYFSHFEDIDLGFRLRLRGERCWYVADALVEHIGSASFGVESDLAVRNAQRNQVWTFFTNMPTALLWKYLPAHLLANLVFLAYYSLRGQARAIWSAKWQALRGMPIALRERRSVQRSRCVSPAQLSRMMDHGILSPYLLGSRGKFLKKKFSSVREKT